MSIYQYVYIGLYGVMLVSYLLVETGSSIRIRAANKIVMAALFLLYGLVQFVRGGAPESAMLGMGGLALAFLGDVLLLWSFSLGGVAFSAANLFFIAQTVCRLALGPEGRGGGWWALLPGVALYGMFQLGRKKGFLQLRKYDGRMQAYLAVVTVDGVLGLWMALTRGGTGELLMGLGLTLFMLSDYFITLHKFAREPKDRHLRANSFTYFVGMLLVSLSMGF